MEILFLRNGINKTLCNSKKLPENPHSVIMVVFWRSTILVAIPIFPKYILTLWVVFQVHSLLQEVLKQSCSIATDSCTKSGWGSGRAKFSSIDCSKEFKKVEWQIKRKESSIVDSHNEPGPVQVKF